MLTEHPHPQARSRRSLDSIGLEPMVDYIDWLRLPIRVANSEMLNLD